MPGAARFGNELIINTTTEFDQYAPALAALPNGRFVAVWTDTSLAGSSAVRGQVLNADGTKFGGEFVVTAPPSDQGEPTVAALADGRFIVAWTDDIAREGDTSGSAVRAHIFNSDGGRVGSEFLLNTTTEGFQSAPTITGLTDGRFVAAWVDASLTGDDQDHTAVRAQIFNANGTRSGDEFQVNTITFESQRHPVVAALPDGGFVVAWDDNSWMGGDPHGESIRAQVFHADGEPSGNEFVVNTTTFRNQFEPAITTLAEGRFVVTWTDDSTDVGQVTGSSVRARIFNGDGSPSSGEILLNSTSEGTHEAPTIAALPDGRFVATWQDHSGLWDDTDTQTVRAQVFNGDGTRSGSEFTANTTVANAQYAPVVTALADGRFAISWGDNSGTGADPSGNSIRAQMFDPREAAVNFGGSAGTDDFVGTPFADALAGAAGNDRLNGAAGDDWLEGGAGSDVLAGGAGNDIAIFAGNRADYRVTLQSNGDVHVIDQRTGSPHDTDTLSSVEHLAFADGMSATVAPLAEVLWRHHDGTVATAHHELGTVPNNWRIAATGDFDGDGDADILWRHTDGLVVTWEMENGAYVTNHNIAFASTGWEIADTGDFDADGDADVLWRHRDGAVVTWEMEDGGYVRNHNIAFASVGWTIQGLGDFDGDGDSDIIWRHRDGAVVTWEMEDGAYVTNHNIAFASTGWEIEGAGDFDGDGDGDILWRHRDGAVVTWEMEDGAYVTNHNVAFASTGWEIEGAGDFDDDGDADILFRHNDGGVVTWEMQDGGLMQTHSFGVVSNAWQITRIAEFDFA